MIESSVVNGVFLPNRESCLEYLRELRWSDGVRCPYCGASRLHKDGYTDKGAAKYHCLNCGKYFNDLTKTIFEHHKFPIEEMFYILKEMEYKSTLQISKELGRKYDSVLAFVREVQEITEKIEGEISLKDLVEIDEIYIMAGEKGIEQDRPRRRGLRRRGRGTYEGDKPPVQAFTERRGKTRFFVKRNLSRDDTKKTLKTVSESEIRVNTDEYSIYESVIELENVKEHGFVNHSKEYAKDGVHVNTAENFNSKKTWFPSIILFPMV